MAEVNGRLILFVGRDSGGVDVIDPEASMNPLRTLEGSLQDILVRSGKVYLVTSTTAGYEFYDPLQSRSSLGHFTSSLRFVTIQAGARGQGYLVMRNDDDMTFTYSLFHEP